MIAKERPSALPVTLSFGDMTIANDESIMGSTNAGRNDKFQTTTKKKQKPSVSAIQSPSLRMKGSSGLADVRVTFKNLQNSYIGSGL